MKFTVYSKDGCSHCEKIKEILDLSEQQYVTYILGIHFTKQEFISEFGEGSTFPQVIVDDKHIGGCVNTVKFLKENKLI